MMFLLPQIRSLHQPKPMMTSTAIMIIITKTTIAITTSTSITVKTRTMPKQQAVYNEKLQAQLQEIWKEKHTNFLNLKTHEEQGDQTDLSQRNKSRECISSA